MTKPEGAWTKAVAKVEPTPGRGLVEVFLVDEEGEPTRVGLELYPPDRKSVQVKLLASEAAALGDAILDGADRAEKENISRGKKP